jgi:hypothetical protein
MWGLIVMVAVATSNLAPRTEIIWRREQKNASAGREPHVSFENLAARAANLTGGHRISRALTTSASKMRFGESAETQTDKEMRESLSVVNWIALGNP